MPDSKITALTALTAADPAVDMFPVVDVSDTTMAASGTTKRISINNILACSPAATLASATITGAATVGTTLGVTGVSTFAAGTALLPALTTTGDTNTGIYYPAADTFAVTTGGTERYRVDSSGNLGIGVAPTAIFGGSGVNGKGLQGDSWTISSLGGSNDTYFGSNLYTSAYSVWSNRVNAASGAYYITGGTHIFYRGAAQAPGTITPTESARIDASGNLILQPSSTPPSLFANGQLTMNATSNTNLRFSYRGSDGVTRVANITLA